MIYRLVVKKLEGRLAVELSADLADALGIGEGDAVYLTSPSGVRADAGRDVELEEGLAAAEDAFRRYDSALRELAQ